MPRAKVSLICFFFFFFFFFILELELMSFLFSRQTGGRKATKTQRRLGFSIHDELDRLSPPSSS